MLNFVQFTTRTAVPFHDHYFRSLSPLTLPSVVPSAALRSAPHLRFTHWDRMLKGARVARPCHSARVPFHSNDGVQASHVGVRLMRWACRSHVSEIHWWAHSCRFPSLALERGHMPVTHSQFIKGWLSAPRSVHWHTCVVLKSVPYWVRQAGCGGMEPRSLYSCS